jgi:hypothetical protein
MRRASRWLPPTPPTLAMAYSRTVLARQRRADAHLHDKPSTEALLGPLPSCKAPTKLSETRCHANTRPCTLHANKIGVSGTRRLGPAPRTLFFKNRQTPPPPPVLLPQTQTPGRGGEVGMVWTVHVCLAFENKAPQMFIPPWLLVAFTLCTSLYLRGLRAAHFSAHLDFSWPLLQPFYCSLSQGVHVLRQRTCIPALCARCSASVE